MANEQGQSPINTFGSNYRKSIVNDMKHIF